MKSTAKKLLALLLAMLLMLSMCGLSEEAIIIEDNAAVEEGQLDNIPVPEGIDLAGDLDILDSLDLDAAMEAPKVEEEATPEEDPDDEAISDNALVTSVKLGVNEKYIINTSSLSGKLTFKSSKPEVANVNNKGIIKGKKVGIAKISVTTAAGKKYKISVTVAKAPSKVTLNKTSATLDIGDTLQLKATLPKKTASNKMTWTSSNKNVATVSNNGKVTAKAAGSATITVKTFNGKKATCKVTVEEETPTPTSIELDDYDVLMLAGTGFYLQATVYPANAETELTWSSSDASKISVDQDGFVYAESYGEAVITVTTDNGLSASCAVKSTDMEVGIYINEPISKVIDEMPISLIRSDNTYHSSSFDVGFIVDDNNIVSAVVIRPSSPVGRFEIFGIWAEMDYTDCENTLSYLGFRYIGRTSSGIYVYEQGSYRIGITYDADSCVEQCMITRYNG